MVAFDIVTLKSELPLVLSPFASAKEKKKKKRKFFVSYFSCLFLSVQNKLGQSVTPIYVSSVRNQTCG